MDTLVLQSVQEAANLLSQGKLVAFPTETVYGLGASLFHEEGIQSVFRAKKRPADNPLIVHVSSIRQVEEIAKEIPEVFYRLASKFWPGPLTLVLQKRVSISPLVSAGLDSIAVRMPSHPLALQLIEVVGSPLVAPSANLSGRPSPTTAAHVIEDLNGVIEAVLEGGPCQWGVESTVISLLQDPLVLLRPGSITKAEIESAVGKKVVFPSKEAPICSPGMKYRHYAPHCPVVLARSRQEIDKILLKQKGKWMVLSSHCLEGYDVKIVLARNLYSLLRVADQERYDGVLVLYDEDLQKDEALVNRLMKASGLSDGVIEMTH